VQLGFVIDHARCIGCHACTVACKSENDVPLGSFRTWVKYTEAGTFPAVKRSFAVLRCNQCTRAPCVTICPVKALAKRPDGIVDVDPARCIGCKSCLQGCPYDALYVHPETGTAQKCHFCAHRTERGLAPACAVVCPTEAILPGDFHDPESVVALAKAAGGLRARKTEAGTGPNVFYREAAPAGLDPSLTNASGGYLWAETLPGVQLDAQTFEALEHKAAARTTYDVAHPPAWGWKVGAYLFTKSVAAGVSLGGLLLARLGAPDAARLDVATTLVALLFLAATAALLVLDLRRPERFLFILTKPNWDSWLARGAVVLGAFGLLLVARLALRLLGAEPPAAVGGALDALTALAAALTAVYTAWLFGQAKGRVLWLGRLLAPHLLVQALVAGAATLCLAAPALGLEGTWRARLGLALVVALALHALLTLLKERVGVPRGREAEYARAVRLLTHGPFARRHRGVGWGLGIVLAGACVLLGGGFAAAGAALALVGLWSEEDVFVRAGQALPIS
jgi:Fe-S-cluster-containing dehydrogenase component/formate-dependent nitrite reductase membrane component NrfD